jgi:predicted nucleic acid-binding protein
MIVVADTSPLITLAQIGCLDQLKHLFGTIHIPSEVELELNAKGPGQGVPDVLALMQSWVVVRAPATIRSFPGLHPGEAAAISMALEQTARLLIDEKAGRKVAAANGVTVIGTVGVLVEAAELGSLDLADSFAKLKATNFRFPDSALDKILGQFYERHPK